MIKVIAHRTIPIEVELSSTDLGHAIFDFVNTQLHVDDAGCDWYTKGDCTYVAGDPSWKVSEKAFIARLVDAGNILLYEKILTLKED